MRTRLSACLLALLCSAASADPAAWVVSGDAGGEIWLFGSVHYLRAQDYPLPPIVDELYAKADEIVMELDMDDLDPALLQTQFLSAAMLPDGQTLSQVLEGGTYRLAEQRAGEYGMDLSLLKNFKPWLIAITLLDLGMGEMGFRPEHGIEQYLLGKALTDRKPIQGLESLQAQISIFDELDAPAQESLLLQTLQELEAPSVTMELTVGAWRDGRLDDLNQTLMRDFDGFPGLYDTLVVERNKNWLGQFDQLLNTSRNYLVVVGALHLVGENSVVEMLRSRGYRVSPLH